MSAENNEFWKIQRLRHDFDGIVKNEPSYEKMNKRARRRILKDMAVKLLLTAGLGFKTGQIFFGESGADLLGDWHGEQSTQQMLNDAWETRNHQLRHSPVTPESLFRARFMDVSVEVSKSGGNGILGFIRRFTDDRILDKNTTTFKHAYDTCLANKSYDRKETQIVTTSTNDGRDIHITVTPPAYSIGAEANVLSFTFVRNENDPIGYDLRPYNRMTTSTLGALGCIGFTDPVTHKINS